MSSDQVLDRDGESVSVVRHEERLRTDVERVPVERVRLVKVVVTEQVTRTVEVRREELRVERLPFQASDGTASPGVGTQPPEEVRSVPEPIELVLHEEEVVLTTRVVPRERVRVWVDDLQEQRVVTAELGREQVEVERFESGAAGRPGPLR